mmetsp:Transcript_41174/g.95692  ORF Transcript_41174/g.95692 Transcript_41174/m.95692 type:complete len:218 (-) Transcript_41174:1759-2412(-)
MRSPPSRLPGVVSRPQALLLPSKLFHAVLCLLTDLTSFRMGSAVPRAWYFLCVHSTCMMSFMATTSSHSSASTSSSEYTASTVVSVSSSSAFFGWKILSPMYFIRNAHNAEATERRAPIFAWLWRPLSVKASFETKSATVSPTPPSALMAKRSTTVNPTGSRKPMRWADSEKATMPSVFPTMRAMSVAYVSVPSPPTLTPALARPKKNMPKSTKSFM